MSKKTIVLEYDPSNRWVDNDWVAMDFNGNIRKGKLYKHDNTMASIRDENGKIHNVRPSTLRPNTQSAQVWFYLEFLNTEVRIVHSLNPIPLFMNSHDNTIIVLSPGSKVPLDLWLS